MTATRIKTRENGQVVFDVGDGFRAVVEPYNDADGGRIVAGGKYATTSELGEMETELGYNVDG